MAESRAKSLLKEFQKPRQLLLRIWGPGFLLVVIAFAVTLTFVQPAPPRRLVIATGGESGAYYHFANEYAKQLAKQGIELEVRATAGSIENVDLLLEDPEVSLALVQGGTIPEAAKDELASIASLYFEPVWVFYRADEPLTQLRDLAGMRVAVGAAGSGTRAVALTLLRDNGLIDGDIAEIQPLDLASLEAKEALIEGSIDAAFFVISPEAPLVHELLVAEDVRLMDIARHEAYPHRYVYLSDIVLDEGVIDLESNLPGRDMHLLAPTATLIARKDLHSAIPQVLIEAASEVHAKGGLISQPDEFPSLEHTEIPPLPAAERYFRRGPTFLHRWLPFWVASFIERMWILALPLLTLAFPLAKLAPPLYRWQIRSRIYKWYKVVRAIDQKLLTEEGNDFSEEMDKLRQVERELAHVSVPWSYINEFYDLRLHLAFIHKRLDARIRGETVDDETPDTAGELTLPREH